MGLKPNTRDRPTSASTRSSSAPAPIRASKICAPPRRWSSAARRVAANIRLAMVVPGSGLVKEQAEREGLDKIFTRRRFRVARAGLLDVPGDERRPAGAGRALRLDLEPQFRRPPGRGRAHPSGQPGDGRRRRHSPGHFVDVRNCSVITRMNIMEKFTVHQRPGGAARSRQRRHRRDHSQAVPEVDQAHRLRPEPVRRMALPRPRRTGQDNSQASAEPGFRAEPAALSGRVDPAGAQEFRLRLARASMRRGRSISTASARSSRRASPTSSSTTASRTACCRSC